jgi:hypothetical protein
MDIRIPSNGPSIAAGWLIRVEAPVSEQYLLDNAQLDGIYTNSKDRQWDVNDFDWSHQLNPDNPLDLADQTLPAYGTPLWDGLDETGRREFRHHFHAWTLSQILHGEQGALLCAAKLAQGESSLSARLCMAAQVNDEARHVEAYSRLVRDKFGTRYGMTRSLEYLLRQSVSAAELDITNLGMQVLVEGMALSLFQNIITFSRDPFIKQLITRIQQDEARHFAAGRITLSRVYRTELSSAELALREEFLCEGVSVLYEHMCADDIWASLGMNARQCGSIVRSSRVATALRRSLFRRLVPTIRDIGLLTARVSKLLDQLGMLNYAMEPLHV